MGDPELAVVAAIHGDEPCGARAIEALLEEEPNVKRPVKFIIANERALERGVRYTETDMNREFPGNRDAEVDERRLAYELLMELAGCTTLSLHSMRSEERPFTIVNTVGPIATAICPYLSVEAVVETAGLLGPSLVDYTPVVEVECGIQGTEQATVNAKRIIREFLAATGVLLDNDVLDRSSVPVYRLREQLLKRESESTSCAFHVENFEPVLDGKPYATIDGRVLTADKLFYPVLMSGDEFTKQSGYAAELTGSLG